MVKSVENLQLTLIAKGGDKYADMADTRRGDHFRLWMSPKPDAVEKFELHTYRLFNEQPDDLDSHYTHSTSSHSSDSIATVSDSDSTG